MKKIHFALLFGCIFYAIAEAQVQIVVQTFQSGLNRPVDIDHAGDGRLFIAEQNGRIRIIDGDGNLLPQPFLDLGLGVFTGGNERGFLGVAFHPDYAQNGFVYVNYTNAAGNTVIARFKVDADDPNKLDPASQKILLTIDQPFGNHNGGDMNFGPDGYLYIASGDGGSANDPFQSAQNRQSLLGKMLRIDVDEGDPYRIPEDNPFAHDDFTLDEIWALGLRNPWRFSFDRLTGDMWIGDVGQDDKEEVNLQRADSKGGLNYGWNCFEGTMSFSNQGPCSGPLENYTPPVHEYASTGFNVGCSITGGYVYRGQEFPDLYGHYIYADYCSGRIWSLVPDCEGNWINNDLFSGPRLEYSGFGEDVNGELYLAALDQGVIYKLGAVPCSGFDVCLDVQDESCLGAADGKAKLSPIGGIAPFEFDWSVENPEQLTAGDYSVTITERRGCQRILSFNVATSPLPEVPEISSQGDTLVASSSYAAYQWYLDEVPIELATDSVWIARATGEYQLEVFNEASCSSLSNVISVVVSDLDVINKDNRLQLSPNPFSQQLRLSLKMKVISSITINVLDLTGKPILRFLPVSASHYETSIDLNPLPAGVYLLQVITGDGELIRKIVKR